MSQADLKQRLVKKSIGDLRQDILLLSKRPQLAEAAVAFGNGNADDAVMDALAAEFEAILGLNPSYMQVRLIGTDGFEKVRVDRDSRGGLPFRLEQSKLQDKGGKSYFRNTRGLKAGGALIEAMLAVARERGCAEVGLYLVETTTHNRPFYEKYGFRTIGDEMRQTLA